MSGRDGFIPARHLVKGHHAFLRWQAFIMPPLIFSRDSDFIPLPLAFNSAKDNLLLVFFITVKNLSYAYSVKFSASLR